MHPHTKAWVSAHVRMFLCTVCLEHSGSLIFTFFLVSIGMLQLIPEIRKWHLKAQSTAEVNSDILRSGYSYREPCVSLLVPPAV